MDLQNERGIQGAVSLICCFKAPPDPGLYHTSISSKPYTPYWHQYAPSGWR